MQVIELSFPLYISTLTIPESGQVLAIGDFDGVHLGHREVIRQAVQTAHKQNLPVSVMTFHPHPREVLGHERYTRCLTPLQDKLDMLAELGIGCVYLVQFDLAFAQVTADQFVNEMLLPLRPNTIVVGFDFAFGHQAKGNADTLCESGHGRFAVEVVRPFHQNGEKVSSTLIRRCLEAGQVEQVRQLLGRNYSIKGTVVNGEARGRQIGFPTANLSLDGYYVYPVNGVYAVHALVDGKVFEGVMNIGTKPTFSGDSLIRSFEVHLFDFNRDIYGQSMRVEFVSYLRAERKFSSIDALIEQIGNDAEAAKQIFQHLS
jgi:riboflavin kinase/FMN adenylyltransferase